MKKTIKNMTSIAIQKKRWIALFTSTTIFVFILQSILNSSVTKFDEKGYSIVSKPMSSTITIIAKIITNLANPITLICVTAVLFFYFKNKKTKIAVVCNLFLAIALNLIIKGIIQRPRPTEHRLISETGYSFPSGHSMVSMAFYGYLIYLIHKNVEHKYIKIILISMLSTLIALIGLSRIYLGVHYASDVLGGFVAALSYLTLYTGILKRRAM